MKKLENRGWIEICEELVMVLLCILMADCCIFGAGRSWMIGPFGFRMMLVALVLLVSVPVLIRDFRCLLQKKVLWLFAGLGAWLAFQAVRGLTGGNDVRILTVDLKGYCYFAVLIPALCVLNSKSRIHMLMKSMLYASLVLAVTALILTFLFWWNHELFLKFHSWDPEERVLVLSIIIEKKVPRLFFRSTNYFLAGCAFSIYFYVTDSRKYRWHYPVITGLCLFGLLVSYTRAVYLAAFITAVTVAAIFMIFGTRNIRIRFWKHLIGATLVFALVTVGLGAIVGTNYIEHGLRRVVATFTDEEERTNQVPAVTVPIETPDKEADQIRLTKLSNVTWTVSAPEQTEEQNNAETMTADSDRIRENTLRELRAWIGMAPILGHGLGKAVACREDGLTEYVFHEMILKTGIIGLIIYLLPVAWMVITMTDKKYLSKPDKLMAGCWLAVLLGFMGFSYYNPYMNASVGVLFYCCTAGVFENLKCRHVQTNQGEIYE